MLPEEETQSLRIANRRRSDAREDVLHLHGPLPMGSAELHVIRSQRAVARARRAMGRFAGW